MYLRIVFPLNFENELSCRVVFPLTTKKGSGLKCLLLKSAFALIIMTSQCHVPGNNHISRLKCYITSHSGLIQPI